jgi:hypothetical protein
MTANSLFLGSPTLGPYPGVVVLDVVRDVRVLDKLMLNVMHVRTLAEECSMVIPDEALFSSIPLYKGRASQHELLCNGRAYVLCKSDGG